MKILLSLMLMSQVLIAAPIHNAIESGDIAEVARLIKLGADVNAANYYGDIPLHMAANNGHVEIAELLIRHRANVDAVDSDGRTPLHIAVIHGHINIINLLIEAGANVGAANEITCIEAGYSGRTEKARRLLIGLLLFDQILADHDGETPEEIAIDDMSYMDDEDMLYDPEPIKQKTIRTYENYYDLQILAARVVNKIGITQDQLKILPYTAQCLITKIIEDGEPEKD